MAFTVIGMNIYMTGDEDDGNPDARVSQLSLKVQTVDSIQEVSRREQGNLGRPVACYTGTLPPSRRLRTASSPTLAGLGSTHAQPHRHR
jgi:hypothetical protein